MTKIELIELLELASRVKITSLALNINVVHVYGSKLNIDNFTRALCKAYPSDNVVVEVLQDYGNMFASVRIQFAGMFEYEEQ